MRDDADWRNYLRVLFNRYRESIQKHPNVGPLIAAHLIGNLGIGFDFVEGVLGALQEAGLSERNAHLGFLSAIGLDHCASAGHGSH